MRVLSAQHKTGLVVLTSAAMGLLVVAGGLAQPRASTADFPAVHCTPGEPDYCVEVNGLDRADSSRNHYVVDDLEPESGFSTHHVYVNTQETPLSEIFATLGPGPDFDLGCGEFALTKVTQLPVDFTGRAVIRANGPITAFVSLGTGCVLPPTATPTETGTPIATGSATATGTMTAMPSATPSETNMATTTPTGTASETATPTATTPLSFVISGTVRNRVDNTGKPGVTINFSNGITAVTRVDGDFAAGGFDSTPITVTASFAGCIPSPMYTTQGNGMSQTEWDLVPVADVDGVDFWADCALSTSTPTATSTPTLTPTRTATATASVTPTGTSSDTATPTATASATATVTPTLTATETVTSTGTPTGTATPTATPITIATATPFVTPFFRPRGYLPAVFAQATDALSSATFTGIHAR
jgi:hypothetical protein